MDKPKDTEDKESWYEFGEDKELEFLKKIAPQIGMEIKMNPEKKKDSSAIDFVSGSRYVDLKKQETPFFKSGIKYGLDPQYCVTFNTNDYHSYVNNYDSNKVEVIFWVDWKILKKFNVSVVPMHGVWIVSVEEIKKWVENNSLNIVNYQRRQFDTRGNARSSYLLNLKNMRLLASFNGPS